MLPGSPAPKEKTIKNGLFFVLWLISHFNLNISSNYGNCNVTIMISQSLKSSQSFWTWSHFPSQKSFPALSQELNCTFLICTTPLKISYNLDILLHLKPICILGQTLNCINLPSTLTSELYQAITPVPGLQNERKASSKNAFLCQLMRHYFPKSKPPSRQTFLIISFS